MQRSIVLVIVLALAAAAGAQVYVETFSYPDGPTIPGWTAAAGTWAISNGRLVASGSGWRYINKDGITAKDCVMDGEFFLVTSTLQFGGLTGRHPGGTSTTNLVMCKIQNNSSPGPVTAFNRCYIYEQPGGSVYQDVPLPRPTTVFCRMILLDARAWMLVDADQNGTFEMTVGPYPLTSVLGTGLVGMNSYGPCEMDNFKFYNAVLVDATGNPAPQPGASLKFALRGRIGAAYQAASSLGRSGISIGSGRSIPLAVDSLFFLTLSRAAPTIFANYVGFLDINGDGTLQVNLPKASALVGVTFYTAFITFDPSGILQVSNDHQVAIVP